MSLDVWLDVTIDLGGTEPVTVDLFSANITHNLNQMAAAVGIYEPVWRPDEIGITTAGELIEPLETGIKKLKANPDEYRPLSAKNGWGTYDQFIPWLEEYLVACRKYPKAKVGVSR